MKRILALALGVLLLLGLMSACTNNRKAEGDTNPELLGHWYQKDGRAELDFSANGDFESINIEASGLQGLDLFNRYQAGQTQIIFSDNTDNHVALDYNIANGELTLSALENSCVFIRVAPLATQPGEATDATAEPNTGTSEAPGNSETEATTMQPESTAPTEPTQQPAGSLAETIIGTWSTTYNGATLTYTFNADGTGSASTFGLTFPIDYSTENEVLTVTGYGFGTSDTGSATFEINDGKLYATKDGETLVFTKQG